MRRLWLIVFAVTFPCLALTGCSGGGDAPSAETQKQASRLAEIQKRTGSNWDSLTKEDKDYLVNDLAHGSEATARMLLGPPPAKRPGAGGGAPGK